MKQDENYLRAGALSEKAALPHLPFRSSRGGYKTQNAKKIDAQPRLLSMEVPFKYSITIIEYCWLLGVSVLSSEFQRNNRRRQFPWPKILVFAALDREVETTLKHCRLSSRHLPRTNLRKFDPG